MTTSPFDHRPDRELGDALRDALAVRDEAAFARRVVAAADSVWGQAGPVLDWWDELSRWAQPGLAAALVLVSAAVLWFGMLRDGGGASVLDDPLSAASSDPVPALLASSEMPRVDEVLAAALER